MILTLQQTREMAAEAVRIVEADEAEALVIAEDRGLTRFANNRIHQNVVERDATLAVRAVLGKRIGVAGTNRLDEGSVAACCAAAVAAARVAPEDPDFPGLPAPEPVDTPDRSSVAVSAFDERARGDAAHKIIERSSARGLTVAGKVSVEDSLVAIANSTGVDVAQAVSQVRVTALSMGPDGGSGWASFAGRGPEGLEPASIGDEAADLAERTSDPRPLEPGEYTVVLAPEAVTELLSMLAYTGLSIKDVHEGSSFMSGHEGETMFSELLSITDDAGAAGSMGLSFDFEGMPKRRTPLVDRGIAVGPVTDSYWAARTGRVNTGHALPAPNANGPLPLDLEISPGDTSVDDMIASVERGVYVTRFHYVNVEDPVRTVLTGMTRDGTFLIEDGRLTHPLRNLRFTQSAVDAFAQVTAVGSHRRLVGEMLGAALVPALLVERFSFTGQTD